MAEFQVTNLLSSPDSGSGLNVIRQILIIEDLLCVRGDAF